MLERYASSVFLFISSTLMRAVPREYRYTLKRNVLFKSVDGTDLHADFYLPRTKSNEKRPAVLVVHGGAWTRRMGQMTEVCENLASAGFVVMNTTYRLAPMSLYPKAVDDVKDAMRFFQTHANDFNADASRIGGWGYSAGAELVLLAGLDPSLKFKALVSGGTPADFMAWPDSPLVPKFIGHTIKERPDLWQEASPVNHVSPQSPPTFLYHGALDKIVEVEQMDKMEAALKKSGVEVRTYRAEWLGHIPIYLFGKKSIRLGIEFLKEKLK